MLGSSLEQMGIKMDVKKESNEKESKRVTQELQGKGAWDLFPLKRRESSTPFFFRSLQILH